MIWWWETHPPTQKKKRKRERVRIERCYDESAARGRRKSNKKSSHQWLIIEQWVDFHFGKILMSWLPLEKHSKTKLEEIERQFMLIEETMITSGGPKRPWVEEKLQEPLMYKKPWLQLSNEEKKKQCCVHFTGFSWINQISNVRSTILLDVLQAHSLTLLKATPGHYYMKIKNT